MKIVFDTKSFQVAHSKQPRGYGSWMFQFEGREVTFHSSTYGEAKRKCVAAVEAVAPAGYVGCVVVEVMS